MANKSGLHCYVSGRVQGVWFRAQTERVARELHLTGWVRNLADGRVEVMAFGEEAALAKLKVWLQRGPEKADVTDLAAKIVPFETYADFIIC